MSVLLGKADVEGIVASLQQWNAALQAHRPVRVLIGQAEYPDTAADAARFDLDGYCHAQSDTLAGAIASVRDAADRFYG